MQLTNRNQSPSIVLVVKTLSKKQVKANVQHRGGSLGVSAGLAAKALPPLFGGLTTALVSGTVEKAVGGRGLYLHPSGRRGDDEL